MSGMMIGSDPKFYAVPSLPLHYLKVKVTDLEFLCFSFALKFKRPNFFANPMMYLIHVWNDDRDWSKILGSTIRILPYGLFYDKSFAFTVFTMSVSA